MNRRQFLGASVSAAALAGVGCSYLTQRLVNPCLSPLPEHYRQHEWYQQAWQGLDPAQVWDSHLHLLGLGDPQQHWVNPDMQSWWHPWLHTQFNFYLNAACVETPHPNESFIERVLLQLQGFPAGAKALLMAFDYSYDINGQRQPQHSAYFIANQYAQQVAAGHPQRLEWIASIHPYRPDCVEALTWAVAHGAKAVKWLPPAMGIDPAAKQCLPFYQALQRYQLPLLTHAGEEKAVHGHSSPDFGNPLRLRYPLEQGVRVIVAHCAALGQGVDLDRPAKTAPTVSSFELFARLMDDPQYQSLLLADVSAMTQTNRVGGGALQTVLQRQDWHPRLLNGSDYPLPGVIPLFSLDKLVKLQLLAEEKVAYLTEIRRYNALLFDFLVKRHLNFQGHALLPSVFMTKRHFAAVLYMN